MKIIRNETYIKRGSAMGKYVSLAGLIVLLIGMVISIFNPQWILISFGCLVLGFILSQVGIYYGNRFVRPDRPDEMLTRSLKGLDDRYLLYHYRAPTPHVLVGPDACYVLSVQTQTGKVIARGDKWKQSLGWRWLLVWVSQESIGNPAKTAGWEVRALQKYLSKRLPDIPVPLTPVVVFTNPDVELDVSDPAVPVIHAKQIKDWLRGEGKGGKLASSARAELVRLLGDDR